MSIEKELRLIIKDLEECDQPYDEIYDQIIARVNKYHDQWYNHLRIAEQEKDDVQRQLDKLIESANIPDDVKYRHSFKRIEEAFEKIQTITSPKAQFETTVWNVRQRYDEIYEQACVARAYIPELGEEYRNET